MEKLRERYKGKRTVQGNTFVARQRVPVDNESTPGPRETRPRHLRGRAARTRDRRARQASLELQCRDMQHLREAEGPGVERPAYHEGIAGAR